MPTIKISDLQGAALDMAVAIAAGFEYVAIDPRRGLAGPRILVSNNHESSEEYAPSTNPAQAWPLILAEQMSIGSPQSTVHRNGGPNHGWGPSGYWSATTWVPGANGRRTIAFHETEPLIAAMQCYVQHKLGTEVELPEVLTS